MRVFIYKQKAELFLFSFITHYVYVKQIKKIEKPQNPKHLHHHFPQPNAPTLPSFSVRQMWKVKKTNKQHT